VTTDNRPFRIGAGCGFAGDRYEPAEILARDAALDALVFECLAERTIALAQNDLRCGRSEGFDRRILRRLKNTFPSLAARNGVILSNAGAANPIAAARAVKDLLSELGHPTAKVAAVHNDDVLDVLDLPSSKILGTDETLVDIKDRIVSANAYLGIEGILTALDDEPAVVITGRVGDASLFLAPIAHHFGWKPDDLARIAEGTLVGHLLECAGQLTGGYFADGNRKTVDGLSRLGFPFADVTPSGHAVYGKPEGTGGTLNRLTVLEQLLYEIEDPHSYLTPDVTLDLSAVDITDLGDDRVKVQGAAAVGVPDQLKVSVGVRDGYLAAAEISYAGRNSRECAALARQIITERWAEVHGYDTADLRCDYIGYNATRPWWEPGQEPSEVRARFTVRTFDREQAKTLAEEVEALYTNGPAGGGGATSSIKETIGIVSTLIPRDSVTPKAEILS
jgi:hypothetical protein